ncbi:MAG: 1-deoxy-D-xylulose-5-phosphate reductoisomerase [Elusimicrobiota bacterium]|jgi:1-deoxy-D-xylulose-5-phosphate reductoisomerase|nr:1-deoxy-D-xylulose-5-phosphate reductoisomerase [Elusimicrobiota bacterium]
MKNIVVLGSSGSIGVQTLDVAVNMKNYINVLGLSVNSNIEILKTQIKKFKPEAVCVNSSQALESLKLWIKKQKLKTKIFLGDDGLESLVSLKKIDTIVCAITGHAALNPILKAIAAQKNIALANKEALVIAGKIIMDLAEKNSSKIIPVDSEHSAIFQCCAGQKKSQIKKILLTASGGPFYKYKKDFSKITVAQALDHPTWKMGKKITIDSATLMNKGLEAIEACVLFDLPIDKIEIVIHPQSIIHSMVEFVDGCVLAQLSNPDMRLPIQYALTYPERIKSNIKQLNLTEISKLEFFKPNFEKFPCLAIAINAAKKGGLWPAIMSIANEAAVNAFLNGKILFTDIAKIISKTLLNFKGQSKIVDIKNLLKVEQWTKNYAQRLIEAKQR